MITYAIALAACGLSSKAQKSDSFTYKHVPQKYRYADSDKPKIQAGIKTRFFNSAYDLTQSLPANYVKDGSVDYTSYLQQAMNSNPVVCFPDFPVLINSKGLVIRSNSTIVFRKNSALILAPTNLPAYVMLRMVGVENVKIYYPVLIGDRDKHTGTTGEFGMGLSIVSSQHITIYGPHVSKCWGDGIYIGGTTEQNSSDVSIINPVLDYNRRDGISIVSGKNIRITNGVISNTTGTLPMCGIDFEPDGPKNDIDSVLVKNVVTYNNNQCGILISLSKLPAENAKHVNIDIDGFVDEKSQTALWLGGFYESYKNGTPLSGNINITNGRWIDNKLPFKGNDNYQFGPNINFKNNSILKKTNQNYQRDDSSMMTLKNVWGGKSHIKVQ